MLRLRMYWKMICPSKICIKCNIEWPLTNFYRHQGMKNGHLNKCKICTLKDVHDYRDRNIDKIKDYDRMRHSKYSAIT